MARPKLGELECEACALTCLESHSQTVILTYPGVRATAVAAAKCGAGTFTRLDFRLSTVNSCPSTAHYELLPYSQVVEEGKLQNQMVAGELFRQGREGDGSVDACKSRPVERVGA